MELQKEDEQDIADEASYKVTVPSSFCSNVFSECVHAGERDEELETKKNFKNEYQETKDKRRTNGENEGRTTNEEILW
ncbi:hypothetical protein KI387_002788 [Taxus chinensis]|uniref:Uncharacterized protein n=1 Tax=Taxus chinensis TaxID=29808 RepID=A0AA38LQ77_TAXCH|nr:hypothetical protein KI387_002788 [Taxus chinensis]